MLPGEICNRAHCVGHLEGLKRFANEFLWDAVFRRAPSSRVETHFQCEGVSRCHVCVKEQDEAHVTLIASAQKNSNNIISHYRYIYY